MNTLDNKLTEVLSFRTTEENHDILIKLAAYENKSLSELINSSVIYYLLNVKCEHCGKLLNEVEIDDTINASDDHSRTYRSYSKTNRSEVINFRTTKLLKRKVEFLATTNENNLSEFIEDCCDYYLGNICPDCLKYIRNGKKRTRKHQKILYSMVPLELENHKLQ